MASVYDAMVLDERFAPTVWLLPYNVADPIQSERKQGVARSLLDAERVPFTEWEDGMQPSAGDFDVAIFGHPYDRERPPSLGFDRIAATIPLTVYIPYGLPMGGGGKNLRLQYAQPTQVRSSLIVARSQIERELYGRYCPAGNAHVQVLGHPRFDRLQRELAVGPPADLREAVGGRRSVLWNAHFSFGPEHSQGSNFSTFDLLGPEIFQFALERREQLCLIWRPHPGLWPALLRNGLLSPSEIPRLRSELQANGIVLDERPGHAAAFCASDALISDAGSFLLEYLATGKPVLALINPEGEPLNEEATRLVAGYRHATTPAEVIQFLDRLLEGRAEVPDRELMGHHLPLQDGAAGPRVVEAIARLARLDRHTVQVPPLAGTCAPATTATREHISRPLQPATVLDRLCSALIDLRDRKRAESRWRKDSRRVIKRVRTAFVEWIKLHPSLTGRALLHWRGR